MTETVSKEFTLAKNSKGHKLPPIHSLRVDSVLKLDTETVIEDNPSRVEKSVKQFKNQSLSPSKLVFSQLQARLNGTMGSQSFASSHCTNRFRQER